MNNRFDYTVLDAIVNAVKTIKAAPLVLGATQSGTGGPIGGYVGFLDQYRVSYDSLELAASGFVNSGISLVDNLNHIRWRLGQIEAGSGQTFLELDDTPDSYSGYAGYLVAVNSGETGLEFILFSGGSGTPGGVDTNVQYNDGGVFGGDNGLRWDKINGILTLVSRMQNTDTNSVQYLDINDDIFLAFNNISPSGEDGRNIHLFAQEASDVAGGSIELVAGNSVDSQAGSVSIYGGDSTNAYGGYVNLVPGNGSLEVGYVAVIDPVNGYLARLRTDLMTVDQSYSFPDETGTLLLEAPIDGTVYGRQNATWVPVASGGLDSVYLRLDASNDPVTGELDIFVTNFGVYSPTPYALKVANLDDAGFGGAASFSNLTGNGFAFYADTLNYNVAEFDQVANSGIVVADPSMYIYRYGDNTNTNFSLPAIYVDDHFTGATDTFSGGSIRHISKANVIVVDINPYAAVNGNLALFNSVNTLTENGRLLSLKNTNTEVFSFRGNDVSVRGYPTAIFDFTAHTDSWVVDGMSALNFTEVYSDDINVSSSIAVIRAGGSKTSPTAVTSGMVLQRWRGRGYYTLSGVPTVSNTQAELLQVATSGWTDASRPAVIEGWTTPQGSTILGKSFVINPTNVDLPYSGGTFNVNGIPHTHTSLSGIPAGIDRAIQYNNNGIMGGAFIVYSSNATSEFLISYGYDDKGKHLFIEGEDGFGSQDGGQAGLVGGRAFGSGAGGGVNIIGGRGDNGQGGSIDITGGIGYSGSGGKIELIPGKSVANGTDGFVCINDPDDVYQCRLLTDLVTDTHSYHFPDANGTFALKEDVDKAYIEGFRLVRAGAAALDIHSGECYAENGDKINSTSTISLTSLSLTTSTLYHVYVYLSGGTPTAEVVTTAPAAPYKGKARSKTSDTTRRYIGSVYATGTNTLAYWNHMPNLGLMMFTQDQSASPWRVLSNGLATTETTISFGSLVPAGPAMVIKAKFSNTSATRYPSLGNSEDGITLAAGVGIYVVNLSASPTIDFPLDASGNMSYLYDVAPATGLYVDLYGYFYER